MTEKQIQKEVKEIKKFGHKLGKSKKKSKEFLKAINHDVLLKLSENEVPEENDIEKLDKEFRRRLYLMDGLSSENYSVVDLIMGYIDERFKLLESKKI